MTATLRRMSQSIGILLESVAQHWRDSDSSGDQEPTHRRVDTLLEAIRSAVMRAEVIYTSWLPEKFMFRRILFESLSEKCS